MTYALHPGAEQDIEDALDFYSERAGSVVAARFLEELKSSSESPSSWLDTPAEAVLDDGGDIPMPGAIDAHRSKREFKGWIWALSEVDASVLSDKAERINITLPARVLRRVDETANRLHESRSGFLARAALEAIRRGELTE